MIEARSANFMALAVAWPRTAERANIRYQWLSRFIDHEHVVSNEVMAPFAIEVLKRAVDLEVVVLIDAVVTLGERARHWHSGSRRQKALLDLPGRKIYSTRPPLGCRSRPTSA